jgi:hypothetical protein
VAGRGAVRNIERTSSPVSSGSKLGAGMIHTSLTQLIPILQLAILERRAGILRRAIILGATTVLLVAILILVLFVTALGRIEAGRLIVALFCLSLSARIGSVAAFIHDMNLALAAVRPELRR